MKWRIKEVIKRFRLSNSIFFILCFILLFVATNLPLLARIGATPPNYTYTFSQGFYLDYDYYLSIMKQGRDQWLTLPPYTTEKATPSLLHIFYLYLGKMGLILGLSNPLVYHLSLNVLRFLFALSIFLLAISILPKPWGRLAFLFALFASSLPPLLWVNGRLQILTPYPWWVPIGNPLIRSTLVPHHLFSQILMVIALLLWLRFLGTKKTRYILFVTLLQIVGIVVFPSPGVVLAFSLGLTFIGLPLLRLLIQRRLEEKRRVLGAVVVILASLATFAFMYWQVKSQASWSAEFTGGTRNLRATIPLGLTIWEYIYSLGVLWVFMPWAFLRVKKFSPSMQIVASMVIAPFLLMILATLVGGDSYRVTSSAPYVAASILACIGAITLGEKVKKRMRMFLPIMFLSIIAFGSIPGWRYFFPEELKVEWTTNVYIPDAWIRGLLAVNQSAPKNTIILSREHVGALVPLFTHLRPYIAHPDLTYNFLTKQKKVEAFYGNAMTIDGAKAFLAESGARYVYWGWYEKDLAKEPRYGNLLHTIYSAENVTIYKVRP